MPVRSFSKVQKHVSKKKGKGASSLHENSRDTLRLRRAVARDDRVNAATAARANMNKPLLDRVAFFQSAAQAKESVFSNEEVHATISVFLNRDDEELETLQSARRSGRPASNRETLLRQKHAAEGKEYESGFWFPDLQDDDNVRKLCAWTGEWVSLGALKFVRVRKDGYKQESSFPPKGAS
ncbi:translation machinery-associated protein 16 [Lineolata rhizophorae]|uniref:Translation machinery-associated protein 16 n=1 Tax=Lineolata rhizophorae TaxID=578093 RepID=A0A6A6P6M2_9PEZI|nr:translation machinery-associated protein 16 [Lineolata rhizophorae]